MINKLLTCLLILLGYLYADNGWSEPILISRGNNNQTPNIIMDKSHVLHAFWAKCDTMPAGDHGVIYYSNSADAGNNWSTPLNISNNPTDRPIYPQIVTDSENNLHLFYQNRHSGKLLYQQKTNSIWNPAEELENYISSYHRVAIDSDDVIYLFWVIYGGSTNIKTHYRIKENGVWTNDTILSDSLAHIDINNCQKGVINLTGASVNSSPRLRAYYYKYTKSRNTVSNVYNVSNSLSPSVGQSITTDTQNDIHIPFYFVPNSYESHAYYSKSIGINSWLAPEHVGDKLYHLEKQIITDSGNNPHLFDQSINQDTLFHFYKTGELWQKEIVISDEPGYWINTYKVLIYNNKLYLVYNKAGNETGKIYLKSKQLTVDISTNNDLQISNYELSNYPNPFNTTTQINFTLPQISKVKLEIFNAKGELVQLLINSQLKSGKHSYGFNANALNSGVYYCRLSTGSDVKTTKLMLLK